MKKPFGFLEILADIICEEIVNIQCCSVYLSYEMIVFKVEST